MDTTSRVFLCYNLTAKKEMEKIMITKKPVTNMNIGDLKSLILMLGIIDGKLDEMIQILTEVDRKLKKSISKPVEKKMEEN